MILENHGDIVRNYEEPSYTFATNGQKLNDVQLKFLKYTEEQNENDKYFIMKCNFRLLGLVNAYSLNERYNLSEREAVFILYETIKKNVKKKDTLLRLEEDYLDFIKS